MTFSGANLQKNRDLCKKSQKKNPKNHFVFSPKLPQIHISMCPPKNPIVTTHASHTIPGPAITTGSKDNSFSCIHTSVNIEPITIPPHPPTLIHRITSSIRPRSHLIEITSRPRVNTPTKSSNYHEKKAR